MINPVPEKFLQDIQGNQITAYPVVIINSDALSEGDAIPISTVKEVIRETGEEGSAFHNFKDYNLKISNIKESISIKNRTLKISNITITLSNYEIQGVRLSDSLEGMHNTNVSVYYKTQSCIALTDCLPVYKGLLKKIKFGSKKVTLTVEDDTQDKFHKDVPIANIGYSEAVYNKDYLNRYIPITYGNVEKAPAVLFRSSDDAGLTLDLIAASDNVIEVDSNVEIAGFGVSGSVENNNYGKQNSPFYIYKDGYFNVLYNYEQYVNLTYVFPKPDQFRLHESSNYLVIEKMFNVTDPENPPAANMLLCSRVSFPNDIKMLSGDEDNASTDGSFIFTNVDATVFNADGIIDNPNMFNKYIVDNVNFLGSFSQIPYQNLTQSDENDGYVFVNELETPVSYNHWDMYIHNYGVNTYNQRVQAWCLLNAHHLSENHGMKIIEFPTTDLIHERLDAKLGDGGEFYETGLGWKDNNDAPILHTYDHRFYNQIVNHTTPPYEAQENEEYTNLANAWRDANGNFSTNFSYKFGAFDDDGDVQTYNTTTPIWHTSGEGRNLPSFYTEVQWDLDASGNWYNKVIWEDSGIGFTGTNTVSRPLRDCKFPAYLWHFYLNDNKSVVQQTCFVGQLGALQGDHNVSDSFVNIFNDGTDTPYLFEQDAFNILRDTSNDEFTSFMPTEIKNHGLSDGARMSYSTYKAKWNGVPFGNLNQNYDALTLNYTDNSYWDRAFKSWHHSPVSAHFATGGNNFGTASSGGRSWFCFFPDSVPAGVILRPLGEEGNESAEGQFIDGFANIAIGAGTFLPTGSPDGSSVDWYPRDAAGDHMNFNYDYAIPSDPEYFVLQSRTTEVASEERLTLAFPMSDLSASDAVECTTFAYGKLKCFFNSDEGAHSPNFGDADFQVRLSAAKLSTLESDQEGLDFDVDDPLLGTNMILFENMGDDEDFPLLATEAEDSQVNWDCTLNSESSDNYFSDYLSGNNWDNFPEKDFSISDWTMPDQFDALVLTYRLNSPEETDGVFSELKTDIFSIGIMQFILFENAFDSDIYIDTLGRANTSSDVIDIDGVYHYKYVLGEYTSDLKQMLENPADIIYHFIEKELGHMDIVDRDSWENARANTSGMKLAFSVSEKVESKKLLEDICKNTKLFPRFKNDGTFGFLSIKDTYGDDDSILVNSEDVIKVSFSRTSTKDINTIVNVKYKKDYAEDEYKMETGYCDGYDFFGAGDSVIMDDMEYGIENGYSYSYFGLSRDTKVLEYECDYIRDKSSATSLRNFIYLNNCNQHTKIKVRFPLKYSMYEVGDVFKFDKLINGMKAYGEDYTVSRRRNGQWIYPYFMIESSTKTPDYVEFELYQLHKLQKTFSPGIGSLSRLSNNYDNNVNLIDLTIMQSFLNGSYEYFTTTQKSVANPTGTGVITQDDYLMLDALISAVFNNNEDEDIGDEEGLLSDINNDGVVNVADIAILINYILGREMTQENLSNISSLATHSSDGNVSISDIVSIVEELLG